MNTFEFLMYFIFGVSLVGLGAAIWYRKHVQD